MSGRRPHVAALSQGFSVVVSCEHAGHHVPGAYLHLFAARPAVLTTHQGYDIGIASVALQVAKLIGVPLLACRTSRLLIEPNRSLHHHDLFSKFSRPLPERDKTWLIEHVWRPHRAAVTEAVADAIRRRGRVLHLALHSFTPVLDRKVRTAEIGVLYDSKRDAERRFALVLQQALRGLTGWRIRRNYPYRGCTDGLTTALRWRFGPTVYLGIEIEWNQRVLTRPRMCPGQPAAILYEALCQASRVSR